MTNKNFFWSVLLLGLLFPFSAAEAQRNVTYQELVQKQRQQSTTFFDVTVLPDRKDSNVQLVSLFSLGYDFLPFKKASGSSGEFSSTVEISLEVFESDKEDIDNDNVSVEGLRPVERAFWKETARTGNYEQSKSKEEFLKGHISVPLSPGIYSYLYELDRGENTDSQTSSVRTVDIKSYSEMASGNIFLGSSFEEGEHPEVSLYALGDNIPFGDNFYALIFIPDYEKNTDYFLRVIRSSKQDSDTESNLVHQYQLNSEDIFTDMMPEVTGDKEPAVQLTPSESGYTYAIVHIPASEFENDSYRLTLHESEEGPAVSQDTFRTLWPDMPASLLSLDVAIDMLHYIVDDNTLEQISSGSQSEREENFKEFWEERDPTPKTAYNELMAEYYRRIDYSYENFTTENIIGYESDQGEIYIKYGAPDDIRRKYPSNGPTTEIWEYSSRQFVFEATTGFGDFELVSN